MSDHKTLLYCLPVSIALALAATMQTISPFGVATPSIASPTPSQPLSANRSVLQLAQSNPPPPPRNPGRSSPGGRRDPSNCPQDPEATPNSPLLTALSPITKPGFTLAERPTFLVYVPKTSAKSAEFSLRSRGHGIYRITIELTNTLNLISFTLPAQTPSLTVGQTYTWSFAIICNPGDRLDDRFVTGMVQRIDSDPARLRQIQRAPLKEQVAFYQKANAWYDALAVLYQLKRSQPGDSSINTTWRELLQSGGVDTMIISNPEKQNSH